MTDNNIDILKRREIEAFTAASFIEAFSDVLGRERALDITREVIQESARDTGRQMAEKLGGNSLASLRECIPYFAHNGALEYELVEASEGLLVMNVTRCRYVDMYERNGLTEYGFLLSCDRDFAFIEGFNPDIRLTRTQTIMEGAPHCDFRYEL